MRMYRIAKEKDDVAIVAVRHDDKILVLKRGAELEWMPNVWNFAGGGIEEKKLALLLKLPKI
jgi:8-oxo-dGTP pyrophosphatase MutT (NUDIX family)